MRGGRGSLAVAAGLLGASVLAVPVPGAANVLTVGVGGGYATLGAAVAAAAAGDTIEVAGGTYVNQSAIIDKPLTIIGDPNNLPVFQETQQLSNDKGILQVDASATIENLVLEGAFADPVSNNGAGIRYEQGNLTVVNSQFIGNQDGILATPFVHGTGSVTVENALFQDNGVPLGQPGSGDAHALYATGLATLTVTGSTFEGTQVGHDIKSRAEDSIIENNTLYDGVTGTTSYAIDLSNGGDATITGNMIDQGPNTQNWIMIAYDAEGLGWADNAALIAGNVFLNTEPNGIGVNNFALANGDSGTQVTVACNAFSGLAQNTAGGPITAYGNVIGTTLPTACNVPAPAGLPVLAAGLAALAWARGRRHIDAGRVAA